MLRKSHLNISLLCIAIVCFAVTPPVRANSSLQVPANVQWTNTGIILQTGQRFRIRATGAVALEIAPANKRQQLFTVTGNRRSRCTDPACTLPNSATGLLVGRVGNGPVFRIGNSQMFKAVNAGELLLGINDATFQDNSGAFAVTVVAYPLPIPCRAAKIVPPVTSDGKVEKTVKISWNPATCRMNVQFYQNGVLLRERKRGDASGTVDMTRLPSGLTEIKIWVPGSSFPSDSIWVHLR
jgi:hypothetical protein